MGNTYKSLAQDGSGGLDYGIVPVALAKGLGKLVSNLVVAGKVTNYSREARAQGTGFAGAVRVPKRGAVAATNKVPGTAATPTSTALTKDDILINKHKTWDILLEDYGNLFTGPGVMEGYLEDGAASLAEAIETDLLALYPSAGRLFGAPGSGMSVALLTQLNKAARQDKWRSGQTKYGILGPEAEEDLLNEAKFTDADRAGTDMAQINAILGKKFGFELSATDLAPSIVGSPGAEHNLFFQREGIGLAFIGLDEAETPDEFKNASVVKEAMSFNDDAGNPIYTIRMIVGYSQLERGYVLSVDTIYGVEVVRDSLVYDVLV